ncbi:MAG: O-antigen ligase family protein [Elusimicrobiota bacterium]
MKEKLKSKLLFLSLAFLLLTNLLFKGGWDIWVQTLTTLTVTFMSVIFLTGKLKINKFVLQIPFLLLFGGLFVSLKFSGMPVESLRVFYNSAGYLVIFIIVSTYFNTSGYRKKILRLVKYTGGLAVLLNFMFPYLFNRPLFPNPNMAAGFFLIMLPLFYDNLLNFKKKEFWLFDISIFFLLGYSLVKTGSHIGMGLFGLSLVYFLIIHRKKGLLLVISPFIAAGFYLVIREIIENPGKISERLAWLEGGWNILKENFLTGAGPGTIAHILPAFVDRAPLSIYLHSIIINIGAQGGVITLTGFLWLVYGIFENFYKSGKFLKEPVFVSLATIFIFSWVEYSFSIPLITITAIVLTGSFITCDNLDYSGKYSRILRSALITGLVISITFTVEPFLAYRITTNGFYEVKTGKYSRAEDRFDSILKRHPDYRWAYLGKAFLYLNQNDFKKSEKFLSRSIPPVGRKEKYETDELKSGIEKRLTQYGVDPGRFLNSE